MTRPLKITVLGAGGVGKSALTKRFVNGEYLEMYDPTIEDSYHKQLEVDGTPCILEVLDTAGIDQFFSPNDQFIRDSDGFILVFSLAQKETVKEIQRASESIHSLKRPGAGGKVPLVVCGNKCDLKDLRQVSLPYAKRLTRELGGIYYDTSARTNKNVQAAFEDVIRQIRNTHLAPQRQAREIEYYESKNGRGSNPAHSRANEEEDSKCVIS